MIDAQKTRPLLLFAKPSLLARIEIMSLVISFVAYSFLIPSGGQTDPFRAQKKFPRVVGQDGSSATSYRYANPTCHDRSAIP